MSKFLTKFETTSAYDAAKGSLNKPNVSYIVETLGVAYNPLIPAWEFDPMYLFSDGTTGKEIGSKVPVGIEVIPASHMSDGKTRFMSLKNMSLADPENGTTATGNNTWDPENPETTNPGAGIMWGASGLFEGLNNYTSAGVLKKNSSAVTEDNPYGIINEIDGSFDYPRIASDYDEGIEGSQYPFVENRFYKGVPQSSRKWMAGPYPFNADGSFNTVYNSGGSLAFSDLNGKANTEAIIAAATATETTGPITNSYEEGHYPAAMACHRYNGAGLKGQWYLPAAGEIGYIWANIIKINEKITAAGQNGICLGVGSHASYSTDSLGSYCWSSSQYGESNAWFLGTSNGDFGGYDGYRYNDRDSRRVRAFVAI